MQIIYIIGSSENLPNIQKTMKPTKQQVKETIAMFAECPVSAVKYNYKKKEFSYFEIVYTPHYDD